MYFVSSTIYTSSLILYASTISFLTSIVIGIPHSYKGQVAKAFIILKNGYTPNEKLKKEIKDLCYKNISKYSLPYEYEFRDKLPKTLIGKVAYRELEKEEQEKLVK